MGGLGIVALVPVLFGTVFVVLVVLTARSRARGRAQRGGDLLAWGSARGWTLSPHDPEAPHLPCPPMEAGGSAHLVARGPAPDGAPTLVVEWSRWEHTSGPAIDSHHQREIRSVVAASPLPGSPSGTAEILPVSAVRRGVARRGRRGALDTGHRRFDERYLLRSDDPRGATVVPPALISWLGDLPHDPDLGLRLVDGRLVCWGPGRLTTPRLEDLLAFSCAVRAHWR